MTMHLDPWFGEFSIAMQHTLLNKPSFITFGVDFRTKSSNPLGALVVLHGLVTTAFAAQIDSQVTFGMASLRLGQPAPDLPLIFQANSSVPGTRNGSSPPPNVAVLIRKVTAVGGRRARGRLYLPWAVEAAFVDERGTINSISLTPLQTAANGLITAMGTNTMPMCVNHSDSAPGVKHPTAVPPATPVTALVVQPVVGTQRRRLHR